MATTIRILEHTFFDAGLNKTETHLSVIESAEEELARVARLPGTKSVFDVEGVVSRVEAAAVLKLSRQPQPEAIKDPAGWGSVEAFKVRVRAVALPAAETDAVGVTLKRIIQTAQEG